MSEKTSTKSPGNKILPFIFLAVIGLGLIGYCIFGAITFFRPKPKPVEASATITAVPPKTPSETAQALINESAQWGNVLEEDFESKFNINGWRLDDGSSADVESKFDIEDGMYTWNILSRKNVFIHLTPITAPPAADFRVDTNIKLFGSTEQPAYGVVFRDDLNGDFYFFGLDGNTFIIDKYLNGAPTHLVEPQASSAILPEAANTMTIIAKGSQFVFLVNNQFIYELSDASIEEGVAGYGVVNQQADSFTKIELTDFLLKFP